MDKLKLFVILLATFVFLSTQQANAFYSKLGDKLIEKYYYKGKMEEARNIIQDHIEKFPEDWEGYFEMARWDTFYGTISQDTFDMLYKTLEVSPKNFAAYTWLGYVYGLVGDRDNSYDSFDAALEIFQDDFYMYRLMVETAYAFGDYDKALKYVDKSFPDQKNHICHRYVPLRFYIMLAIGDGDEATKWMGYMAKEACPDHTELYGFIVDYYVSIGKYKKATEYLEIGMERAKKSKREIEKTSSLSSIANIGNPYARNPKQDDVDFYTRKYNDLVSKASYIKFVTTGDRAVYEYVGSQKRETTSNVIMILKGIRLGETDFLIKKINRFLVSRDFDTHPYAFWAKAVLYESGGKKEEAEKAYLKAISSIPLNVEREPSPKGLLGESELSKLREVAGRVEMHLEYFESACLSDQPENGTFLFKHDDNNDSTYLLRYIVMDKEYEDCRFYIYAESEPLEEISGLDDYAKINLDEGEMARAALLKERLPEFMEERGIKPYFPELDPSLSKNEAEDDEE